MAQGRQPSAEDPATVGDGDAQPGGREEMRDARTRDDWRGNGYIKRLLTIELMQLKIASNTEV